MKITTWNRRPVLGALITVLALGAGVADADLCDPDDVAAVADIQDAVDGQLTSLGDLQLLADELLEAAEHELEEVEGQAAFADAVLEVDLAQLLIGSCAGVCSPQPAVPASSASSGSGRCWTCAHPRLMVAGEHGGYLEQVVDLVQRDLNRAIEFGLDVDTGLASQLVQAAQDAVGDSAAEDAFALSCQAFSVLACAEPVTGHAVGSARIGDVPAAVRGGSELSRHRSSTLHDRAQLEASLADRRPGSRVVDGALVVLGLTVDLVSNQLAGLTSVIELYLDELELIEGIGHEVEELFEDQRRRQLESILISCAHGAASCLDPNILTSALNEDCQDYSMIGGGHHLRRGRAGQAPPNEDHVPEFECLLRDIISVVAEDLEAVEAQGLIRDLAGAAHHLDHAIESAEDADGRAAFGHACEAFELLMCP